MRTIRPFGMAAGLLAGILITAMTAQAQELPPPQAPEAASPEYSYVVMGKPHVNIRTGPSMDAMVIGKAEKGDVFQVVREIENWFEVLMFSGEVRYVTNADYVYPLTEEQIVEGHRLFLPPSSARSRAVFWDSERGLDRAAREASEIVPATMNREIYTRFRKIMEDRILLEMFHIHGVQPAVYGDLVAEARREGWN
ncbi:SH3 domain-containing protein [Gemmatimonadota bacterium]